LKKSRADLEAYLAEILDQLTWGIHLWWTSSTCEENLILQEANRRVKQDRSDLDQAEAGIAAAQSALQGLKSPKERREAEVDLKLWQSVADRAESQKAADLEWARQAVIKAKALRQAEEGEILDAQLRGRLRKRSTISPAFARANPMFSVEDLGGTFRMGELRPMGAPRSARDNQVPPSVPQCLARFQSSCVSFTLETLTSGGLKPNPRAPTSAPGAELIRKGRPKVKPSGDDLLGLRP
jgi:hypothetical protein